MKKKILLSGLLAVLISTLMLGCLTQDTTPSDPNGSDSIEFTPRENPIGADTQQAGGSLVELDMTSNSLILRLLNATIGYFENVYAEGDINASGRVCDGTVCLDNVDTDTTYGVLTDMGLQLSGTDFGLIDCETGKILGYDTDHWECVDDANTQYSASGTLLDLTGTTFSILEGTLTDGKFCKYEMGTGLVCNYDASSYTAGTGLNLTGSEFSIAYDSVGDAQLTYNTGQHLTTSSNVQFAQVTTPAIVSSGNIDFKFDGNTTNYLSMDRIANPVYGVVPTINFVSPEGKNCWAVQSQVSGGNAVVFCSFVDGSGFTLTNGSKYAYMKYANGVQTIANNYGELNLNPTTRISTADEYRFYSTDSVTGLNLTRSKNSPTVPLLEVNEMYSNPYKGMPMVIFRNKETTPSAFALNIQVNEGAGGLNISDDGVTEASIVDGTGYFRTSVNVGGNTVTAGSTQQMVFKSAVHPQYQGRYGTSSAYNYFNLYNGVNYGGLYLYNDTHPTKPSGLELLTGSGDITLDPAGGDVINNKDTVLGSVRTAGFAGEPLTIADAANADYLVYLQNTGASGVSGFNFYNDTGTSMGNFGYDNQGNAFRLGATTSGGTFWVYVNNDLTNYYIWDSTAFRPSTNNVKSLGTDATEWKEVWAVDTSINHASLWMQNKEEGILYHIGVDEDSNFYVESVTYEELEKAGLYGNVNTTVEVPKNITTTTTEPNIAPTTEATSQIVYETQTVTKKGLLEGKHLEDIREFMKTNPDKVTKKLDTKELKDDVKNNKNKVKTLEAQVQTLAQAQGIPLDGATSSPMDSGATGAVGGILGTLAVLGIKEVAKRGKAGGG